MGFLNGVAPIQMDSSSEGPHPTNSLKHIQGLRRVIND